MDKVNVRTFKQKVKRFYKTHGRHDLPWRATNDPYHILVSEIMLQQTQVPRVIPKYKEFLKRFPTAKKLADAPLKDVLHLWSGLGYNRRARMLQQAAQQIERVHKGVFPKRVDELTSLPGVGPYTAGAVAAFAFNTKVSMIETNIRTVFIHEFFPSTDDVSDSEIMEYVDACIAREPNPREWYAALMDYGTHIKQTIGNANRKSKHYATQSAFQGSLRQVRGKIIKVLIEGEKTTSQLQNTTNDSHERVVQALTGLQKDGMVTQRNSRWRLAT